MEDPRAGTRSSVPTPRLPVSPIDQQGAILGATAAEMSQRRYGGPTRIVSSVVNFTTTVSRVLPGNPRRVHWLMVNRGTSNVAIDVDPGMTAANGLPMAPAGGFISFDVDDDGEAVAWDVYGASDAGTMPVRVLEILRV